MLLAEALECRYLLCPSVWVVSHCRARALLFLLADPSPPTHVPRVFSIQLFRAASGRGASSWQDFSETTCFPVRQSEACELFFFAFFLFASYCLTRGGQLLPLPGCFPFFPPSPRFSLLSAAPPPPPPLSPSPIGLLFIQVCCTHLHSGALELRRYRSLFNAACVDDVPLEKNVICDTLERRALSHTWVSWHAGKERKAWWVLKRVQRSNESSWESRNVLASLCGRAAAAAAARDWLWGSASAPWGSNSPISSNSYLPDTTYAKVGLGILTINQLSNNWQIGVKSPQINWISIDWLII